MTRKILISADKKSALIPVFSVIRVLFKIIS